MGLYSMKQPKLQLGMLRPDTEHHKSV